METKVIVDSDILIDLLRNETRTVILVKDLENSNILGTTDINAFELYHGAYKSRNVEKNLTATKGLLNTLFLISTNEDSMETAGKLLAEMDKKGIRMGINDVLIAAMCLVGQYTLLTRNKKDFSNIPGIKIL